MDLAEVEKRFWASGKLDADYASWLIQEVKLLMSQRTDDHSTIERLKVDCECHRIQAVDRGNSYKQLATGNQRLLAALQNILNERGEDYGDCDYQSLWKATEAAKPAIVDELARLTALCDEYRGERDHWKELVGRTVETMNDNMKASTKEQLRLESALTRANAEIASLTEQIKAGMQPLANRMSEYASATKRAEDALTRARAEGMAEAVAIITCILAEVHGYGTTRVLIAARDAISRAAKGEQ